MISPVGHVHVVIKPKFNIVGSFSGGLAPVAQQAITYLFEGNVLISEGSGPDKRIKHMYIDKRGSVVITGNFESVDNFSEGLAVVEIDGRCSWANDFRGGTARVEMPTTNGLNTYGYIDRSGRVIWKP